MLEVLDIHELPINIGGEEGKLLVCETIVFNPQDYIFHRLSNGQLVLAVPRDPTQTMCHLFVRCLQEAPRYAATFCGVYWHHQATLMLSLEGPIDQSAPEGIQHTAITIQNMTGSGSTLVTEQGTKVNQRTV